METTMQIVSAVLAVPLGVLGFRSLLTPTAMANDVGLSTTGTSGLSEIRSVLGGLLAGSAALIVIGLITDESAWFLAVAVLMGVAIAGRIVSLLADGFERAVVPPLLVEIVVVAVMLLSAAVVS